MVDTIKNYKVFITPLLTDTTYVADRIDVTDYVRLGGIGKIKEEIDSGDYDIGLYTYAALNIKVVNYDGTFNDERKAGGIFFHSRDRAKVEVEFTDIANSQTIVFKGIINEEATREDFIKQELTLKVLSQDSILRKTKVTGGTVRDGMLFSTAIKAILNKPVITSVLTFDPSEIVVDNDLIIDDASPFTQRTTRQVLELLMVAGNSVFYIDSANKMIVRDRTQTVKADLELFGGGDPLVRDNIITVKKYNSGLHRAFNTVIVNNQISSNDDLVNRFGARVKEITFDFVTNASTSRTIADKILATFGVPKDELEVTVGVDTAKDVEILDPVRVSFVKQYFSGGNERVALYGSAIYGQDFYPYNSGGLAISNTTLYKITGILQDTKRFEVTLRLREVGTKIGDLT